MKKLLLTFDIESEMFEVTFGESESDAFTMYFEDADDVLRYVSFVLLTIKPDEKQQPMDGVSL